MRILFATKKKHFPQVVGGSQSSTHDLCVALGAKGHTCAVMSELLAGDLLWLKNRIISKVSGKRFVCDHVAGYPVYRGWNVEMHVTQVADDFKPDIIVVQAGQPMLVANSFLRQGYKTVVYARDVEFDRYGGELPLSDNLHFLANSEFTAKRLREHFGCEAISIPPLVCRDHYLTKTCREAVLFLNPSPEKGVNIALNLAADNPDIPFLFVETWEVDYSPYKRQADKLPNVSWLRKQNDMKSLYGRARVVLAPSCWQEAWCRVVSEAQVSGIPVMASNRGGLPESTGPGGMLVACEASRQDWSKALRQLWFDADCYERVSLASLRHSQREEFQPEALLTKFEKALQGFLESGPG